MGWVTGSENVARTPSRTALALISSVRAAMITGPARVLRGTNVEALAGLRGVAGAFWNVGHVARRVGHARARVGVGRAGVGEREPHAVVHDRR